jgi:primosomal protein N' (replication factor Y)
MGDSVLVDVAVPLPISRTFTYSLPDNLAGQVEPGCRLLVPFGRRHLIGMAVRVKQQESQRELKPVMRLLDPTPLLDSSLIELGLWLSWYYLAPLGEAFRVMLPPGLMAKRASPDQNPETFWPIKKQLAVVRFNADSHQKLTQKQAEAVRVLSLQEFPVLVTELIRETACTEGVLRSLAAKGVLTLDKTNVYRCPWAQLRVPAPVRHKLSDEQSRILKEINYWLLRNEFHSLLIHGVTASGKTEIYLNAIESFLKAGKSALILVPEIGLTPQITRQFRAWFKEQVAILHSALSAGERFDQWRRIREGQARVVVGTRSAIFAPLPQLGLIIVDEEHDTSYKQEDQPRYNARDTALKRGQLEKALVLLGSATPQLETYHPATTKGVPSYQPLTSRVLNRPLPRVHILDMRVEFQKRGKATVVSEFLASAVRERLRRKEQTLILLNRRGYASALLCRSCGHTETCGNCSITLTYHSDFNRLTCHYCGYSRSVPSLCSQCGKKYVYFIGEGTERIQEILDELFPRATIDRLDRDTVQRKGSIDRILSGLLTGKTDILIGTQMIAKGHDFPGVTLVGVLGADLGLRLADFRAAERTFQLLTQVAGRAGRGDRSGEVVIQTYYPNHYALKYACTQNYQAFSDKELEFRRRFLYPPFVALASLIVAGEDRVRAWSLAEKLVERLREARTNISSSNRLRILGPAPAAIERLKGEYRFQVIIKTTNRHELHDVVARSLSEVDRRPSVLKRISIDIDPLNLM